MQLVSQLQIIHKLGYTHGDLKFQNICYNPETQRYTLIDFALVAKIFYKNGQHKPQERINGFYGNSLFASDTMIHMKTSGRKDDLESLMYILCYLHNGTLPVIKFINQNIENFHMSQFCSEVLQFRRENIEHCHKEINNLLPQSMKSAFKYIIQMKHEDKPDYNLIKLWLAFSEEDENRALNSKINIKNEKIAKGILYEYESNELKEKRKQEKKLEELRRK